MSFLAHSGACTRSRSMAHLADERCVLWRRHSTGTRFCASAGIGSRRRTRIQCKRHLILCCELRERAPHYLQPSIVLADNSVQEGSKHTFRTLPAVHVSPVTSIRVSSAHSRTIRHFIRQRSANGGCATAHLST